MENEILWIIVACICCIAVLLFLFKTYNKLTKGVCKSDKRLDEQVIIITGANTGIGKETALDFARRGAKVILACRDLVKANKAKEEIVEITKNRNVVVRHLDLASLKSVRKFAREIIDTESRLDVLVNNAGMGTLLDEKTEDGLDVCLQVNHFGHFLLTNLLIDLLKKSAPSRIVHLSSTMYRLGRINLENMNCENSSFFHNFKWIRSIFIYSTSKLYVIIGSNEFSRRLVGSGVTSNSLHPGVVRTEIMRELPLIIKYFTNKSFELFFKSPVEGAQTTIYLSIHDKVKNISGKYFMDCQEAHLSSITRDVEVGKKFWEKCCDLVNLKPEERFL